MTPEQKTIQYLFGSVEPFPEFEGMTDDEVKAREELVPLQCDTFEELCERFHETNYVMSQTCKDAFAVVLATILSTRYKSGDRVWIYLIGPSGSGKTTLIMAAAGLIDHTFFMSKFTGLHSGMRDKGDDESSLFGLIQDRTLIVKDWTTVLKLPPTTKDSVYSDLRDSFDGESAAYFKNHKVSDYKDVCFSIVACCTESVRRDNYTDLGERFLQVELLDEHHSRQEQIATTTRS
jgi:energy-coupling factor transporter ATP-binding protein EcfA2